MALHNENKASINAESYAQAAMSIYLQQIFGLDNPPAPVDCTKPPDTTGQVILEPANTSAGPTPVALDAPVFRPANATGEVTRLSDYGSVVPPPST